MLSVFDLKIIRIFGGERLKERRWEIRKVERCEIEEVFREQRCLENFYYMKNEYMYDRDSLKEGSQFRKGKIYILG